MSYHTSHNYTEAAEGAFVVVILVAVITGAVCALIDLFEFLADRWRELPPPHHTAIRHRDYDPDWEAGEGRARRE